MHAPDVLEEHRAIRLAKRTAALTDDRMRPLRGHRIARATRTNREASTAFHTSKCVGCLLLNRGTGSPAWGRSGNAGVARLSGMLGLWWWFMEFIVLDVAATLALLAGYLAIVIRKAVV
jgi:hypothetical protein